MVRYHNAPRPHPPHPRQTPSYFVSDRLTLLFTILSIDIDISAYRHVVNDPDKVCLILSDKHFAGMKKHTIMR